MNNWRKIAGLIFMMCVLYTVATPCVVKREIKSLLNIPVSSEQPFSKHQSTCNFTETVQHTYKIEKQQIKNVVFLKVKQKKFFLCSSENTPSLHYSGEFYSRPPTIPIYIAHQRFLI